jgi:DNA-binding CsgD family transcriptional regulator
MAHRSADASKILANYPPLPLSADHWQAVVKAIGISGQQAKVAGLVLRDLGNKQIAQVLGLGEGTVKVYLKRIAQRTRTSGRMQLAAHVLAVSHQVNGDGRYTPKGWHPPG